MRLSTMRGFMLIEVLVALVLTALALAAWLQAQAMALQQTRINQHRTLAMLLAADMAEILRASPAHASVMEHAADSGAGRAASGPACQPARCDAPAWAAAELQQWRDRVRQTLPEGASQIRIDSLQRSARITLAWREGSAWALTPDRPAYLSCPAQWAAPPGAGLECLLVEVAW